MRVNKLQKHEVLHVSSIILDMIDNHLLQHPAIENNPLWKKLAGETFDAAYKLYQQIGADTV